MVQGAIDFLRNLPPARIAAVPVGLVLWVLAWRRYRKQRRETPAAEDPAARLWVGLAWSGAITLVAFAVLPVLPLRFQRLLLVPFGAVVLLTLGIGIALAWQNRGGD